jgi:hypothetical protein
LLQDENGTKGTFIFAPGKSGMKRNKSFCLNLFLHTLEAYPFAPGRKRNKKERFLLQEKIGTKKNVYLYSGKSGTKRNVSFHSGNVEQKEINTQVFMRTKQPKSPPPLRSLWILASELKILPVFYIFDILK